MDVNHINAFLEATKAIFDTMLRIPVTFERPELSRERVKHDISGVIGLSGDVVGSVVVGFPKETAVRIVSALAGEVLEFGTPDFLDAIGELTNMIAGGAKSKFDGLRVTIGCPLVITSPDHNVTPPTDAVTISIPCDTPGGRFAIEVAFRSVDGADTSTDATENGAKATSPAESSA